MNRRALLVSAAKPSWSWNFAARQAVPPGASFSHASTGTCSDGAGVLRSASSNVARFDCDPVTGAPLGYLAEMQSANLVTYSQDLANPIWSNGDSVTRAANAVVSPDETMNASTITEDSTTNRHECDKSGISLVQNSVYGLSVFVKKVTGARWLVLSMSGGLNYFGFNPCTQALVSGGTAYSAVSARAVGNGWYRLSALFTAPITSTGYGVYMSMQTTTPVGSTQVYAGDGVSTLAVWGVQIETAGVGVTSYIPTAGAAATRAQDVLTMPLAALPGWNPSRGGMLVASGRTVTTHPATPGYTQSLLYLNAGAYTNAVRLGSNDGLNHLLGDVWANGSLAANVSSSVTPAPYVPTKAAIGWGVGHTAIASNGYIGATPNGALPNRLTTLNIGNYGSQGGEVLIDWVGYFAGVHSDAVMQQVVR